MVYGFQAGHIAIHLAAYKGHINIIKMFLNHGVDVNIRGKVTLSIISLLLLMRLYSSYFLNVIVYLFLLFARKIVGHAYISLLKLNKQE